MTRLGLVYRLGTPWSQSLLLPSLSQFPVSGSCSMMIKMAGFSESGEERMLSDPHQVTKNPQQMWEIQSRCNWLMTAVFPCE